GVGSPSILPLEEIRTAGHGPINRLRPNYHFRRFVKRPKRPWCSVQPAALLMTSLYVDIVRLRIAALEIVKRRLAVRIIENVFDLSLERLAFDCSYGEQ